MLFVVLLMKNLNKAKELGDTLNKLAQVLLSVKKEEIKEIERLKR